MLAIDLLAQATQLSQKQGYGQTSTVLCVTCFTLSGIDWSMKLALILGGTFEIRLLKTIAC